MGDPKCEAGQRDVAIPPHIVPAVTAHLAEPCCSQADALLFPRGATAATFSRQPSVTSPRPAPRPSAPTCSFHDLRHSGAVLAAQAGATLAELMARLGHSTPAAAIRYQHQPAGRD